MILGFSERAHAWEIKMTGDGTPIRWPDGEIEIALNFSAELHDIDEDDAEAEVRDAFASWNSMLGEQMSVRFESDDDAETERDGTNAIHWGTDPDDSFIDPVALGTTYLTYKTSTGQILEADIVINGVNYEWMVVRGDCTARYDLQNILAHEIGHFYGIAHSVDHNESTMYPSAAMCETKKRQLSSDDQDAILFLYNSVTLEASGSLADELMGCSAGGTSGLGGAALVLGLLAAIRLRRRASALALGVATCVALPGFASASTLYALEPVELVAQSDVIAQGTVVKQEVVLWRGQPMTVSTLAVSHCDDVTCPATTEVHQLGGEIGDLGMVVSGVHHLDVGSEVVVFLRATKAGLRPVGRAQGIFKVSRLLGQTFLSRDLRGAALTRRGKLYEGGRNAFTKVQFDILFGAKLLKTNAP